MDQEPLPFRTTFFIGFFVLVVVVSFAISEQFKKESLLVFCDVGQGDAAYIRLENKIDVLIDAGSSKKILTCLGKYMPFYDRSIEYAFLSHPQKDHYGGFSDVVDRYKIQTFVVSYMTSKSTSFEALINKLKQKGTNVLFLYGKSKLTFTGGLSASLIWPTRSYINNTVGADPNVYSQVVLFDLYSNLTLFTGDLTPPVQPYVIDDLVPVDILKVPHHGSRNGLTKSFLDKTKPKIAVISVGKNNSYGHPSPAILNMLQEAGATVRRTDREGDIVFRF